MILVAKYSNYEIVAWYITKSRYAAEVVFFFKYSWEFSFVMSKLLSIAI